MNDPATAWPSIDWSASHATFETLQMLTQIVGKTRLALTPVSNHWWNVPLYVTARGLTTAVMSLPDGGSLDIEFDFVAHALSFRHSDGRTRALPLRAQAVAEFYAAYLSTLAQLGVRVTLNTMPVEVANPIPFEQDTLHASYDPDAVQRFWTGLRSADAAFKRFSSAFCGKISPVHFFWGSFDLAVTRFNGRKAPVRAGVGAIQAEAYSHECISAGFWPGNGGYGQAAFYCYAAPVPAGLSALRIRGPGAYDPKLGEFILNYADLRDADDPDGMLRQFLDDTYAACADAAQWDHTALEHRRHPP